MRRLTVVQLLPAAEPLLESPLRQTLPVLLAAATGEIAWRLREIGNDGRICDLCTGGREYRAVLHNCRENIVESATVAVYNAMARKLRDARLPRRVPSQGFTAGARVTKPTTLLARSTGCSPCGADCSPSTECSRLVLASPRP